jgi:hypothetical protein
MMARNSQYSGGSGTNPSVFARGETVSQSPAATMITEVRMSGPLARLSIKGILLVQKTCQAICNGRLTSSLHDTIEVVQGGCLFTLDHIERSICTTRHVGL